MNTAENRISTETLPYEIDQYDIGYLTKNEQKGDHLLQVAIAQTNSIKNNPGGQFAQEYINEIMAVTDLSEGKHPLPVLAKGNIVSRPFGDNEGVEGQMFPALCDSVRRNLDAVLDELNEEGSK